MGSSALNVGRSAPAGAVFLSYAREDADAARRIAEALRSQGLEVWFDLNELRGGEAWDAKIKKQIRECTLFVAIVSQQTQARGEGYFRREWKLAAERTNDMAAGIAFIVPVVIDELAEAEALAPDEFMRVQWTRLPGGLPTSEFVAQVKTLLGGQRRRPTIAPMPTSGTTAPMRTRPPMTPLPPLAPKPAPPAPVVEAPVPKPRRRWPLALLAGLLLGGAVGGWLFLREPPPAAPAPRPVVARKPAAVVAAPAPAPVVAPAPGKSIAVLPFANMSADKNNDFLADGIHEDVLTSLAKIRDLKVISRTSVLAYRDTAARNLKKIAADLGVAVVLEGSVRRMGDKVRVTAQLIDAQTDGHLWAETYDGDAADVFALQARLAQQIAAALQATLTAGERTLIERRLTQDAQAYEFYQRAKLLKQATSANSTRAEYEAVIALYEQAVARDPGFALAHVDLAYMHGVMYWFGQIDATPERRARAEAALASARRLAPDAPETRLAQGVVAYLCENDWAKALTELRAAAERLPNDDSLQYLLGITFRRLGRLPEAITHFERAVALNPHDRRTVTSYVETLVASRRFDQVPALIPRFSELFPGNTLLEGFFADARLGLGGDYRTWVKAQQALPKTEDDPGFLKLVGDHLLAGDLAAVDRVLADPKLRQMPAMGSLSLLPTMALRAQLSAMRGDKAALRKQVALANEALSAGHWSPRQQLAVNVDAARVRVCAGENGAVAALKQALEIQAGNDAFVMASTWPGAVQTFAVAGEKEEALACLRRALSGPCATPPEVFRHDLFLASLRSDPRFEEILKSAQPL